MNGVKLRSKAKWIDDYFCNLENRNFISKCMASLISDTGEIINGQHSILHEQRNFIKKNIYMRKKNR